jgi:hypothetical protein
VSARAELLKRVQAMSEEEAAAVLLFVDDEDDVQDIDTITDEEYAESLRRLAEMKAGDFVRWEDLKRELKL